MGRTDIHGEENHDDCPDPYCCKCECHACKEVWFQRGRPKPDHCPVHGCKTNGSGGPKPFTGYPKDE